MRILILCAMVIVSSLVAHGQQKCSGTDGERREFKIENRLSFAVDVREVRRDCSEMQGVTVGAGRAMSITTYANRVYRVYENFTDRLLAEIELVPEKAVYTVSGFEPTLDPKKKLCSRKGFPKKIWMVNATGADVSVRFVTERCREMRSKILPAGRKVFASTFVNNVFRAYDTESNAYVGQVVVVPNEREYVVGGVRHPKPVSGFAATINQIRKAWEWKEVVADTKLNKACQWFSDFMAREDKKKAGNLVSDLRDDKPYPKMETPEQRMREFGVKKKHVGKHIQVTSVMKILDPEDIGLRFAVSWTANAAAIAPKYSGRQERFRRVGFGVTPSPSDPTLYYGCTIFAWY